MSITLKEIQKSVQGNKLSLSCMGLDDEDIISVCDFLTSNPNITSLDVSVNKITDKGSKAIAVIPSLAWVDLSFNEIIGDESAEAFAANTNLESLRLFGNPIGDLGAEALLSNRKEISPGVYKSHDSSLLYFMALGGFIVVAGIVALALGITLTTFASPGIAVVGILGFFATLIGIGIFVAAGKYHRMTTLEDSLEISNRQAVVMSPKEMLYLYGRNVKGTFFDGFVGLEDFKYVAPVVWVGHLFLLPLTLTLGAGIKTLIDIFTRKEQPSKQMAQLNGKIDDLDSLAMQPFITELTSYDPKSISSRGLKATLETIAKDTTSASKKAQEGKKWLLQIDQLTSVDHPEPLKHYTKEYISASKLDSIHQEQLTYFIENKSAICDNQKLRMQKKSIQNYLGAEKNAGKRLHNIIHHHFFPVQIEEAQADNEQNSSITSLLLG